MQQREQEIALLQSEFLRQSRIQESTAAIFGRVARLEADVSALRSVPRAAPTPPLWSSAIAPEFPKIFAEFRRRRFSLLWLGSRDGFGRSIFHSRCDGHPNTLTVILDTNGNIFGGFTPVEWESRTQQPYYKADPSLKSFIFTLKNPHNFPARRFALKADKKDEAIFCQADRCPNFFDICVLDECNTRTDNMVTLFGSHYTNGTGQDGHTFLAGSMNFQVKEIEVFEITD
jgi:hypothetical protein